MKIVVFGASGGTGRQVVAQALAAGHEVTAFVRDPAAFAMQSERLRIVRGDTLADAAAVEEAVRGQDAVVSALGRRNSFRSANLIRDSVRNIAAAMKRAGVRRLVLVSAMGVGESRNEAPLVPRILYRLLLTDIFADKKAAEDELRQGDLDWTVVYPVLLTDQPLTGRYRAGEHLDLAGIPKIPRADVAHFVLALLASGEYLRKVAVISA